MEERGRSEVKATVPVVTLNFGESASSGTGMLTTTLFAVDLRLNWDLHLIMYSTRECECLERTVGHAIGTCAHARVCVLGEVAANQSAQNYDNQHKITTTAGSTQGSGKRN